MSQDLPDATECKLTTKTLKVGDGELGQFKRTGIMKSLDTWVVNPQDTPNIKILREAANYLQTKDTPVAFPTETVYGLGADATRSAAVKGIYTAKGRPSDNPLIVHVSDLDMLRSLLVAGDYSKQGEDPIPQIYEPLIRRFWPGPLTILLPNPSPSKLAPEVTAGLKNFGARMPLTPLALSLIKLTGRPLAAPSANASTKPSPTAAEHVLEDLDGRIELIIDGGSCLVGVESTVVDGLSNPPVVLRPGGVGIDELRSCEGWENVQKAYKDVSESTQEAPRAPGMKYKHYSPKARVVLYEASAVATKATIAKDDVQARISEAQDGLTVGVIRTKHWTAGAGFSVSDSIGQQIKTEHESKEDAAEIEVKEGQLAHSKDGQGRVLDVYLGEDIKRIAQGLFSALRVLDKHKVDIIFVEGVEDDIDIAAAVMNRLRKAASEIRS